MLLPPVKFRTEIKYIPTNRKQHLKITVMNNSILYICTFALGFTLSYWITGSIKGKFTMIHHFKATFVVMLILAVAFVDLCSKL